MDEQQPADSDSFDDDVYVRAWWQRSGYLHGTERDDEAARALDWAEDGIRRSIREADPESPVSLLWRLVNAPGAVPEIVGDGPLTYLLQIRGPEVEQDVAETCASDPLFRQAMAAVDLTDDERAALPQLDRYLPPLDLHR